MTEQHLTAWYHIDPDNADRNIELGIKVGDCSVVLNREDAEAFAQAMQHFVTSAKSGPLFEATGRVPRIWTFWTDKDGLHHQAVRELGDTE